MNVLEFVSSLVWPAVVVGTLIAFRKTIRSWLRVRPDTIKAGPFEAQWGTAYREVASKLQAGAYGGQPGSDGSVAEPDYSRGGVLGLELHDIARVAPVEAILRAWWVVEKELEGLADTAARPGPRNGEALYTVRGEELVPPQTLDALHSLRRLRNVAVHGVEPVSTAQALEFINLAEVAVAEVRSARQRREFKKMNDIDVGPTDNAGSQP